MDAARRLGRTVVALWFTSSVSSLVLAAELFPFKPPPGGAPVRQQTATPLSAEDRDKVRMFAEKANALPSEERARVASGVQESLDKAVKDGDWAHAAYYDELLRRIR